MSVGDRLGIAGLIVGFLAIALMYLAPDRKGIGWIALAAAVVLIAGWFYFEAKNPLLRAFHTAPVMTTLAVGIAGGVVVALLFAAIAKNAPLITVPPSEKASEALPEVALRFVYPKSPALVIVNSSNSLARDIKWTVVLWNMDLPDRADPLPIPVSTFDWLKPHQEGGPQNLFGGGSVAPLLKSGDRLFGSASVNCPNCARGRTYIVYIVYGNGGWVSDLPEENSGGLIIPPNVLKETREEYFKNLEARNARGVANPYF